MQDAPFIEFDGEQRFLAALAPKPNFGGFMKAADKLPNTPRNKWFETSFGTYGARILNQKTQGSCVGHGSTTAFEIQWLRQGGQPVNFSACFLYALINGGRDAGAIVSDAIDALTTFGLSTEEESPFGQIYRSRIPKKAFEVAAKFKVEEAYHVDSWDAIVSEILRGRTVVHGIRVGNNYANLDSNGVAPLPNYGGGGHCQMSYDLKHINGKWVIATQNSWGSAFGMNGSCYLTEQHFDRPGSVDAFSIKFVDPQADNDFPPEPRTA